jgi:hypothetical protein
VKGSSNIFVEYAPVWGILALVVFIFLYVTLPSIEMNKHLNLVRAKRLEEIELLRQAERRLKHLKEALSEDPITIESYLRKSFGSAKREGEVPIDGQSR